jgi:phage baseplate assembly protein gpV
VTFPPPDTVTVIQASYDAAADKLVVKAISDALPAGSQKLTLAVQSGGATVKTVAMGYKAAQGYYQKVLFGLTATPPDAVTVTSSGGGSDSVTLPFPPPDTVAVTLASYDGATDKLVVQATSDALPAGSETLTLAVQSGGVTVKTVAMSYKAASGYYQKVLFGLAATPPDAVTVTSSGGGGGQRDPAESLTSENRGKEADR